MRNHDRGTAICLTTDIWNVAGEAIDPSSLVITVIDPNGVEKVTEQAMIKNAVGEYSYIWQSNVADAVGEYTVITKAVGGIYTSYKKELVFALVSL